MGQDGAMWVVKQDSIGRFSWRRTNMTPNARKTAATPKRKAATPKRKAATPKRKAATPKRKAATPKRKASTPKKNAATPKKKATTPKKVVTPKRKAATPKRKRKAVIINRDRLLQDLEKHKTEIVRIMFEKYDKKRPRLQAFHPDKCITDVNEALDLFGKLYGGRDVEFKDMTFQQICNDIFQAVGESLR
jgi:hypothetical protein